MGTGSLDYNNKFYGYISVLYLIFPYFDIFKLIKQLIKNIPKIFWQSKRNINIYIYCRYFYFFFNRATLIIYYIYSGGRRFDDCIYEVHMYTNGNI